MPVTCSPPLLLQLCHEASPSSLLPPSSSLLPPPRAFPDFTFFCFAWWLSGGFVDSIITYLWGALKCTSILEAWWWRRLLFFYPTHPFYAFYLCWHSSSPAHFPPTYIPLRELMTRLKHEPNQGYDRLTNASRLLDQRSDWHLRVSFEQGPN